MKCKDSKSQFRAQRGFKIKMTWGKTFNLGKCENSLLGKIYMLSEIASTSTVSEEEGTWVAQTWKRSSCLMV